MSIEFPLEKKLITLGEVPDPVITVEVLTKEGFLPFNHKYLGPGFSILKYAFKAYYETEKVIFDIYDNIMKKMCIIESITDTKKIKRFVKILENLSNSNYTASCGRMPEDVQKNYEISRIKTRDMMLRLNKKI